MGNWQVASDGSDTSSDAIEVSARGLCGQRVKWRVASGQPARLSAKWHWTRVTLGECEMKCILMVTMAVNGATVTEINPFLLMRDRGAKCLSVSMVR